MQCTSTQDIYIIHDFLLKLIVQKCRDHAHNHTHSYSTGLLMGNCFNFEPDQPPQADLVSAQGRERGFILFRELCLCIGGAKGEAGSSCLAPAATGKSL